MIQLSLKCNFTFALYLLKIVSVNSLPQPAGGVPANNLLFFFPFF
jgi:hypothetical protein